MDKSYKRYVFIVIFIIIFLMFGYISIGAVRAKESAPGDFFYSVDISLEDIELLLANDEKDIELYEEQLEERVKEMEKLAEENEGEDSEEDINAAYELFEEKLNALNELLDAFCDGGDSECDQKFVEKVTSVGENTLKHVEVLSDVYAKLVEKGNENAADSVLSAMEKSLNGHEKAIDALTKDKGNNNGDNDEEESFEESEDSVVEELEKKFKEKKEQAIEKINLAKERSNKKGKN